MSDTLNRTELFTGTMPVAERQRFDMAALELYLRAHIDGFAGPLNVEQFKGGQSNPTFKLITPGKTYVLRSKPGTAAKRLPSAHAIDREFRVMRGLAGSDVPVAKMQTLCEDESVIGRAFYVMDFVDGRVFWDPQLPGMTPRQRAAITSLAIASEPDAWTTTRAQARGAPPILSSTWPTTCSAWREFCRAS